MADGDAEGDVSEVDRDESVAGEDVEGDVSEVDGEW
jgi:hypothetical protein